MPDTKVSALTEDTTPTVDDYVYTVNDPAGTPVSRRAQVGNLPLVRKAGDTISGASPVTLNVATHALVIDGQGRDVNGITFKSNALDPTIYAGNAFVVLKSGAADATDSSASGSLLFRVTNGGAVGVGGNVHIATGLRQPGGYTSSYAMKIEPTVDTVLAQLVPPSGQAAKVVEVHAAGGGSVALSIDKIGTVLAGSGSAALPAYSFVGDPDTGFYNTADAIGFVTAGVMRAYFNTTALNLQSGISLVVTAANLITDTTTGVKIGTATNQKVAFHNSTPVIQRAGAAQAVVAVTGATNVTPYGFTTAAQADAIVTLVNELRAALVEKGLIKGAA